MSNPQLLREAPVNNVSLENMTREELAALALQQGLRFNLNEKKEGLIQKILNVLKD